MGQPSGSTPQPPAQTQSPVQPGPDPGPAPAPPRKRSRVLVAVVVVAVAAILAVAGLSFLGGRAGETVIITGVRWSIFYTGAGSGYFGPSPQTACSICPWIGPVGARLAYTLVLTNGDPLFDHAIDTVTVRPPFSQVSISPSLPIPLAPGERATITLTIQVPSTGGSYLMFGATYAT